MLSRVGGYPFIINLQSTFQVRAGQSGVEAGSCSHVGLELRVEGTAFAPFINEPTVHTRQHTLSLISPQPVTQDCAWS